MAHSPADELDLFRVSSNPLMSPFLASDSALKKMPPISLLVSFWNRFCVTECAAYNLFF
jgi:hypothetical protein